MVKIIILDRHNKTNTKALLFQLSHKELFISHETFIETQVLVSIPAHANSQCLPIPIPLSHIGILKVNRKPGKNVHDFYETYIFLKHTPASARSVIHVPLYWPISAEVILTSERLGRHVPTRLRLR
jgi:hypothetical protein